MSIPDILLVSAGSYLLMAAFWQIWITPLLRRRLAGDAGIGFCSILLHWYCRMVHRISVSGEEHLSGLEGPLIVACNHSSPIDPLLIQTAFPRFIKWMMAIDQMPPDTQMIWRFTRVIPTDRRNPSARAAIRAIRSLRSGDVVGIFPNEASIRRLVGAILMEQTEQWTVQRARYMTLETLAPVCDDLNVSLPAAQRRG